MVHIVVLNDSYLCRTNVLHNMAVSVRFNESELGLLREYAALYNMSQSEVIRKATMAMIEDSLDIAILETAMDRISKDGSKMYTFEEAGKELGFQ